MSMKSDLGKKSLPFRDMSPASPLGHGNHDFVQDKLFLVCIHHLSELYRIDGENNWQVWWIPRVNLVGGCLPFAGS